jgi:hypothetical protein
LCVIGSFRVTAELIPVEPGAHVSHLEYLAVLLDQDAIEAGLDASGFPELPQRVADSLRAWHGGLEAAVANPALMRPGVEQRVRVEKPIQHRGLRRKQLEELLCLAIHVVLVANDLTTTSKTQTHD